jgi:hypothetical protein
MPDVFIDPFRENAPVSPVLDRANLARQNEVLSFSQSVTEHYGDLLGGVPLGPDHLARPECIMFQDVAYPSMLYTAALTLNTATALNGPDRN